MPLDDATIAVIRRLYFVDRWSLDAIGDELGVSVHAVRRSIVLPGEQPDVAPTSVVAPTRTADIDAFDDFDPEPEEYDL
jgi:hypothetical protein